MDELTALMSESKVDPASLGEHPRFSKYKNANKAAEQQASRRVEYLERQRQSRHDHLCLLRKLDPNENYSDDDDTEDTDTNTESEKPQQRRYADQLMLSEWLVDIPESLSDEWIMVLSPVGKRVLVVCVRGTTYVYNKGGRMLTQFKSALPSRSGLTVLDAIWSQNTFYCLDLLIWDGTLQTEYPFDLRRFILNSKLQEQDSLTKGKKFSFAELPQCSCKKEAMEQLLAENSEKYNLDGLLFYFSQLLYEAGQNPLIGWLKPWMLPEILGVEVPEKFKSSEYSSSGDFIKAFNMQYGHKSLIDKPMDVSS